MKQSSSIVAIYVILGVLNLGLGLAFLTASSIINFLVGGYMLFRAHQEYQRL